MFMLKKKNYNEDMFERKQKVKIVNILKVVKINNRDTSTLVLVSLLLILNNFLTLF